MRMRSSLHLLQRLSGQRLKLQQAMMKWPIRAGAAAGISLLAISCVPESYPGGPPIQGPGPGWNGAESSAYRAGHADGSRDKRQNRRYNPYARQGQFPPATRDDYVRGYSAGFRNANDNPWSKRRAYELGQNYGRRDKLAGRPMSPDRNSSEVPQAVRSDFRQGYREAWNSTAGPGGPRPPRPPRPTPY